jgi:putative endonuclease
MNQSNNLKIGKMGEEFAGKYLEKYGYKIIERNYRTKYAEIDLIARKGREMVFVEVRTKRGENFGTPEETINKKKLRKIWGNVRAYVAWKRWKGSSRVDAICIVLKLDGEIDRLNHYQNII